MDDDLMIRYPAIVDLARRAKRRMPHFAWEYLDSGTGADEGLDRNRTALTNVRLVPKFMKGRISPSLETTLFGRTYATPFGISPVGLTGLMWPRTEKILAATAAKYRVPYALSTVATESVETIGPIAGDMSWFQLYPPTDPGMRRDLLARAQAAGFTTLLVTADVPAASRRERQVRAEVSVPPRHGWRTYLRAAMRPAWSLETLGYGMPRFRGLDPYTSAKDMKSATEMVANSLGGTLSWDYLDEVRKEWDGPIVVKGIMDVGDARTCVERGMDGMVVSNHGARQFDGAPGSIEVLPKIADAVGDRTTLLFDSGVRGGLDICRALALGADFVMLGRAFVYAVGALADRGGNHAMDILTADLLSCLHNLGCESLDELRGLDVTT